MLYGDACSGVSGALHERLFANVKWGHPSAFPATRLNRLYRRRDGLAADPEELKAQWRHWLVHEMGWLDRQTTPIWHATRNHTTYDKMS